MADIEKFVSLPTISDIFLSYEKNAKDWRRPHLGASLLGTECSRALWYSFRWSCDQKKDGRTLRLLDSGNREEERLVSDLLSAGIEVDCVNEKTGEQYTFSEVSGHAGGSYDGFGRGFKESSKWHVLEFKTSNEKNFRKMEKEGVEKAKPLHYAQMQLYMLSSSLERAYYFVVNKNTDEIYGERVRFSRKIAEGLLVKAKSIIYSQYPLERISDDPTSFACRFCAYKEICFQEKLPEVNCRTCLHSTPESNGKGRWSCAWHKRDLSVAEQKAGCSSHLFIPSFIPSEAVDANEEDNSVTYQNGWINGVKNGMKSVEMREEFNMKGRVEE